MGVSQYMITVESDTPPNILLGQDLGGAMVVKLEQKKAELVGATELAKIYNLSVQTIRSRLASINQGTEGKFLYNPEMAHTLLTKKKTTVGRKRAN